METRMKNREAKATYCGGETHSVRGEAPTPKQRDWVPQGQVQSGARLGKMPAGRPSDMGQAGEATVPSSERGVWG